MATSTATALSSSVKGLLFFGRAPSSRRPTSSSFVLKPSLSSLTSTPSKLRSSCRLESDQPPPPPKDWEWRHRELLVDSFHRNNALRALLHEVSRSKAPFRLLERDGDWTEDSLWAVVALLVETGRADEALKVFDCWKSIEMTRNNISNYSRIIKMLCGGNFMSEAMSAFEAMKRCGLIPSLVIYNAVIHGFARKKDFDNSSATFATMLEAGLLPTAETYNGLIRAYGGFGLYDEMSKCVKRMESSGCSPDEVTYNILIMEYAKSGLLEKMEGAYRILSSKHMKLQSSTLLAMLEAYADLGILDKMDKVYRRVLKSKAFMKEYLIRKIALIYIKNYRFSQLEELGNDISAKQGRTALVWHILLLSSACLLSKKGVESIVDEMGVAKVPSDVAKVPSDITIKNILLHFYFKMRDFRSMDVVFLQARVNNLKPDIMTFGIFFDACKIGYDGTRILEEWRRNGSLDKVAELKTDDMVMAAFGKGIFLKLCETKYRSVQSKENEKKIWRYVDLISLVFGNKAKRNY